MKIYLNKRDMKQLKKILGLGWTELKEDFFWALEVGMKSWKRFGLKSWTRFGLKSWKRWGWIGQHVFAEKKKKKKEKRWRKREKTLKQKKERAETERQRLNWEDWDKIYFQHLFSFESPQKNDGEFVYVEFNF